MPQLPSLLQVTGVQATPTLPVAAAELVLAVAPVRSSAPVAMNTGDCKLQEWLVSAASVTPLMCMTHHG